MFLGFFIRLVIIYPPLLESWLFKKMLKLPFQFLAGRIDFDEIIEGEENYLMPLKQGVKLYRETADFYPDRILDLGTGTGAAALYLAETFSRSNIVGIDAADDMLVAAKNKADKAGYNRLEFIRGDIYDLPFEQDSFSLITASNAPFSLTEVKRTLKPDGYLLLSLSHFGSQLQQKEDKLKNSLKKYGFGLKKVEGFGENGVFLLISLIE